MEFRASFDNIDQCPPFLCSMWDWDGDGVQADYLGSTVFTIDETMFNLSRPAQPRWYSLKYGTLERDSGSILVSMNVYPATMQSIPYGEIDPPTKRYYLNMKVLGLRGLKSLGVFDVKKPYIRFDLNSLRPAKKRREIDNKKDTKTQPKETGPNANILTIINLEVDLPNDPFYCPALSCCVYDFYLQGMAQPLLGTFSIPLGIFLQDTLERQEKKRSQDGGIMAPDEGAFEEEEEKQTQYIDLEEEEKGLIQIRETRRDTVKQPPESLGRESSVKRKTTTVYENPRGSEGYVVDLEGSSPQQKKTFILTSDKIVVRPKYEIEKIKGYEIERNKPDPKYYVELGYDTKDRKEKHYRYFVDKPLEETDFVDQSPFDEIEIKRGSAVDDDCIFSKIFGKHEQDMSKLQESETVGIFKAMITVLTEEEKQAIDDTNLNKRRSLAAKITNAGDGIQGIPDVDFLRVTKCTVRCYVIEGCDLADKDENSASDPYLKVQLGDKIIDDSANYQDDEPNPKFYKLFEFPTELPGAGLLKITVMDHDDLSRDDLIGETTIDIEDRWFSKKFRSLEQVPIEKREIFNPTSRIPQGALRLFVEIFPMEETTSRKKWDISPKPPKDFQLRVIIWDCDDMPLVDSDGASDYYIVAKLNDGTKSKTDTHWRSQNGKLPLPPRTSILALQAWDKDLASPDDYICESFIDFEELANEAFQYDQAVKMRSGKSDKIKIDCRRPKKGDLQGRQEKCGSITYSLELVPMELLPVYPAGPGRSEPNQNPYLPPPMGRVKFSLNPLDMWEQYIGPVYRRRAYCISCLLLFCTILIFSLPMIATSLLTKLAP